VGTLFPGSASSTAFAEKAFWARMAELGWREGENLFPVNLHADGNPDRLSKLVSDLLSARVNVMVIAGTHGAIAAKRATQTIPIVGVLADPVGAGLAQSLARPGGNVTGVSVQISDEIPGKWLELVREAVPELTTVAVVVNPDNPSSATMVTQLSHAAEDAHVRYLVLHARRVEDYARVFREASRRAQAAIVTTDGIAIHGRYAIAQLAAQHRLPVLAGTSQFVEAGTLMAYGPDEEVTWRKVADYVDKILKGANAADLPIQQPTEFSLSLNLKTAKALGIKMPESLLLRANQVIR
jgi:putative ABC transport system substrate-binding protein